MHRVGQKSKRSVYRRGAIWPVGLVTDQSRCVRQDGTYQQGAITPRTDLEGKLMNNHTPRNPEPKRSHPQPQPMPPMPWRFTDWAMI